MTGVTTVTGSVQRTIQDTTQVDASGFFSTTYRGTVDHELLRNLLVGGEFSYTLNEFEGISREDDQVRANIYARYLMHRNLYLSVKYSYEKRDSSEAGSDFTTNLLSFRVEVQL